MKLMTGTAAELDGCIDLRLPPMLENRMHAIFMLLLFCLLIVVASCGSISGRELSSLSDVVHALACAVGYHTARYLAPQRPTP
jgi:hypothetical protein